MLSLFTRILGKVRRKPGQIVLGLVGLGITIGAGVSLRWGDPLRWWHEAPIDGAVRHHWKQAQVALKHWDITQARKHLDHCLEICPVNAEAQFVTARTCRREGDAASWELHLKMAEYLTWPAEQIALERQLQQAESGNSWSVEQALLDKLNRLPPEEVLILESLVKGYLNNVRFQEAIEFSTTWLQRHPGSWLAYLYRGRAYQGLSVYERAIADFQEAVRLRPDFPTGQLWFADTLLANRQYEMALEHYQAYDHAVPNEREVLFAMAQCQLSLGKPEARATIETLLARYPNHAGGLLMAAKMDLAEDAPDQALRRSQRALELLPNDLEIVHFVALVLNRLDRKEEAERFKMQRKKLLGLADQLDQLKQKIEAQPEDAEARFQVGKLYHEIGQEREAVDWFQSVLWLNPDHRPTHLALSDYWKKQGQAQRAAYHLRRAEGKQR